MKQTIKMDASNKNLELQVNHTKATKMASITQVLKLMLFCLVLSLFSSCSRDTASGCGTWPMSNAGNHRVYKSNSSVSAKNKKQYNSKQYAYYKKYN